MLMKLVLFAAIAASILNGAPVGEALYQARCAACHDGKAQARMPGREEIAKRSPEDILKTMMAGAMQPQSAGLSAEDGRAIARYLTGKEFGKVETSTVGICAAGGKPFRIENAGWNGWGVDAANTRYQDHGGLNAEEVPKLKLKWAFGFPGTSVAYAQPAVVGGRVFVGSGSGKVYSLDAATGCTHWSFDAGMGVRTAISIGKSAAYFGDLAANVYAVDVLSGKLIWKAHVDDHPVARITGSPVLFEGRLYVPVASVEEASAMSPTYECCKFRGSIVALDAATGKQIWKSYSVTDPPKPTRKTKAGVQLYGPAGAAIWSAPTIDAKRKLIYAATGNSYTDVDINTSNAILAIDMDSGRLKWASQVLAKDNFVMGCRPGQDGCPAEMGPDADFGSSPILRTLANGKQIILAGQKSSRLYGMDPEQQGKVLWQIKLGQGGGLGGIEWGFAADTTAAYVAVSDRISRGGTPGGLHAVRLEDGEKLWSKMPPKLDCDPRAKGCNSAQSAAVSMIPGVVFSGSIDGHLRAFSTKTGEIVWDFNSAQTFQTVNGIEAIGGSIDGAGPVIANGLVLTNSGYGVWNGLPGNVLLAFSVTQ
jgi:polyvinyl alcohol dehydrogenase (cytochrome)